MNNLREVKPTNLGKCRFCGESILWIRTAENNKPMPLQRSITTIVNKFGEVVTGRESHFAHCEKYPKKESK